MMNHRFIIELFSKILMALFVNHYMRIIPNIIGVEWGMASYVRLPPDNTRSLSVPASYSVGERRVGTSAVVWMRDGRKSVVFPLLSNTILPERDAVGLDSESLFWNKGGMRNFQITLLKYLNIR